MVQFSALRSLFGGRDGVRPDGRPGARPNPGPDAAKASAVGRLIAFQTGGRAAWTPRDFAQLAREGYARNAIVYRLGAKINPSGCLGMTSGR